MDNSSEYERQLFQSIQSIISQTFDIYGDRLDLILEAMIQQSIKEMKSAKTMDRNMQFFKLFIGLSLAADFVKHSTPPSLLEAYLSLLSDKT